jgi:hypothetical protein
MLQVTWFRNNHEQRNDLLRFGFMRLHRDHVIRYRERPLDDCASFGFSEAVRSHEHRHTSVVLLSEGSCRIRCLIDSEDSFFWLCPLISEVDLYFCAGYNSTFFEHGQMVQPYSWQRDFELQFYKSRSDELLARFGEFFGKVRRFVPIGPSLASGEHVPFLVQKLRNLQFRAGSVGTRDLYWQSDFIDFERRYRSLLAGRAAKLRYDVVLRDTLWGWPQHRQRLHSELAQLAGRRRIHSALNWSDPVPFDGSVEAPLNPREFPMVTGPIKHYEEMLAQSRLAVFATGFHWGWRSIMSVALMFGLPVYMDRPLLEPWFRLDRFVIFWNEDGTWGDLEAHLKSISDVEWERIKSHNQRQYDELLKPERVASYVIETALNGGDISPLAVTTSESSPHAYGEAGEQGPCTTG